MGRIARSWQLTKASWAVLRTDKELAILPLISGIVMLVICAGFVLGMGYHKHVPEQAQARDAIAGFLFYVVAYTTAFFFQAALVAGAMQRLNGGDPTLGSALGAATKRLPALFLWGVIAATVGMILRGIQERSGLVGKIVAGLLGVVWSLATFFMVPILVMEQQPVGASFKSSWALFKKTWGETVVGNLGLGLIGFVGFLLVAALTGLFVYLKLPVVAVLVGVVGFIGLMVVMSALSGIYLASLYRFATTGQVSAGFDRDTLVAAFREKGAKA